MSESWPVVPLGDLVDVLDSKRVPITKKDRTPGSIPYFGATGVLDWVDGYIFDEPLVLVGEDGAKWESGARTAFQIAGKSWVNNHAHVLRPKRDIVLDAWLVYVLVGMDLTLWVSGLTVPKLNQGSLRQIPIPLPPLDEQRRIVAKLDEITRESEAGIAVANEVDGHAKLLLQAQLEAAIESLAAMSKEVPMADLTEVFSDGDWVESKDQSESGTRLVQTGNVGVGVFKDRADRARFISDATFERLRCTEVLAGDCLVSRLPDPVGRACLVPELDQKMITAVDCTIVRFDQEKILAEYFVWFSRSRRYQRAVDALTTGATRSRISRKNLGQIPITVPPLNDQQALVDEMERLRTATDQLAANSRSRRERFERAAVAALSSQIGIS